jgi:hypothetical protein
MSDNKGKRSKSSYNNNHAIMSSKSNNEEASASKGKSFIESNIRQAGLR